jgi:hypothetical protein
MVTITNTKIAGLDGPRWAPFRGFSLLFDNPGGWTIKFKFSKLAKWGNRVLVARLEPADRESEDEFRRIVVDRNDLSVRFQKQFGFKITDYSPHVSLGYFANKEYAELATPQIDRWTGWCEKEAGDLIVAFRNISLYGFTDMVTFFKAEQSASRAI